MKKIIITVLLIALVVACTKTGPTASINLGVMSTTTSITSVSSVVSNGSGLVVGMTTTPGAKYSLQAVDFQGNATKIIGFTASDVSSTQTVDLTTLRNGDYNLVLIDIAGNQSKINIVIKH